jgi:hypothetical protein
MHVRLLNFDVMQVDDRVQGNHPRIRRFADHLAMHLAAGWYIDDEIALDPGGAREAMARRQRPSALILLFGGADGSQVRRA